VKISCIEVSSLLLIVCIREEEKESTEGDDMKEWTLFIPHATLFLPLTAHPFIIPCSPVSPSPSGCAPIVFDFFSGPVRGGEQGITLWNTQLPFLVNLAASWFPAWPRSSSSDCVRGAGCRSRKFVDHYVLPRRWCPGQGCGTMLLHLRASRTPKLDL
jgi:hypothetical protein